MTLKPGGRRSRRWSDLSPRRKAATVTFAAIQLGLAGAAWADLARRPASVVRGPKWRWALVIAVNYAGPAAYFIWGRRQPGLPEA
jgi:Phospholipase_D-nuclease N-terminal